MSLSVGSKAVKVLKGGRTGARYLVLLKPGQSVQSSKKQGYEGIDLDFVLLGETLKEVPEGGDGTVINVLPMVSQVVLLSDTLRACATMSGVVIHHPFLGVKVGHEYTSTFLGWPMLMVLRFFFPSTSKSTRADKLPCCAKQNSVKSTLFFVFPNNLRVLLI